MPDLSNFPASSPELSKVTHSSVKTVGIVLPLPPTEDFATFQELGTRSSCSEGCGVLVSGCFLWSTLEIDTKEEGLILGTLNPNCISGISVNFNVKMGWKSVDLWKVQFGSAARFFIWNDLPNYDFYVMQPSNQLAAKCTAKHAGFLKRNRGRSWTSLARDAVLSSFSLHFRCENFRTLQVAQKSESLINKEYEVRRLFGDFTFGGGVRLKASGGTHACMLEGNSTTPIWLLQAMIQRDMDRISLGCCKVGDCTSICARV